jgi:hypothetical protein
LAIVVEKSNVPVVATITGGSAACPNTGTQVWLANASTGEPIDDGFNITAF